MDNLKISNRNETEKISKDNSFTAYSRFFEDTDGNITNAVNPLRYANGAERKIWALYCHETTLINLNVKKKSSER